MEAVLPGPKGVATLMEWIRGDLVDLPLAIRFFKSLCQAMAYSNRKISGFVHGDLKPENIFIGIGYSLKISDFGLACASGFNGPSLGSSIGTPLYLAPECWNGRDASEKSDVYAAGIIMYEMLSKRHPFQHAKDQEQLKWMHLNERVQRLNNHLIDRSITEITMQCLDKDPLKRPNFRDILTVFEINDLPNGGGDSAQSAVMLNNKGKSFDDLGDHREAIKYYIKALSIEPDNAIGRTNFAVSLSKLGLNDQAEEAYESCFKLREVPPQAYANYAAHLLRSGKKNRFDEAILLCDKCLELDPDNFFALLNKSALLNSLGRHKEASKVAEKAQSIDPSYPSVLVGLGFAYLKMGRRSKAKKCVKKAFKLDPNFKPAEELQMLISGGS